MFELMSKNRLVGRHLTATGRILSFRSFLSRVSLQVPKSAGCPGVRTRIGAANQPEGKFEFFFWNTRQGKWIRDASNWHQPEFISI